MKRCINCNNLLAQQDRDVCLKCLRVTIEKKGKKEVVIINEKNNN